MLGFKASERTVSGSSALTGSTFPYPFGEARGGGRA
jgi:hypothetical protein